MSDKNDDRAASDNSSAGRWNIEALFDRIEGKRKIDARAILCRGELESEMGKRRKPFGESRKMRTLRGGTSGRILGAREKMKNLYLIGGTMGVGKTTVCKILKEELQDSVFLDGDWCWNMHPFQVTEETKSMVLDNICHLLNNFLHCSAYKNVIFCWVMHRQEILDEILSALDTDKAVVHCISLLCEEEALVHRIKEDIARGVREEAVIEKSLAYLPLYRKMTTQKIDTSNLDAGEVAQEILRLTGAATCEGENCGSQP